MDDLVAFLSARLDEDEQWARAASKPYKHAIGSPETPSGGVHWQWVTGGDWTPAEPELGRDIIGEYGENVQLTTVETWPTQIVSERRKPYTDHIVEMDSAAAGHIVRHDPARTLREVEAKRALLDEHGPGYPVTFPKPSGQPTCGVCHAGGWDWEPEQWPCPTVRHLTAVYSGHPDYRDGWKP